MKNNINILLTSLLIVLTTVYFINCRQVIVNRTNEVMDMYYNLDAELDELELKVNSDSVNNESLMMKPTNSGSFSQEDNTLDTFVSKTDNTTGYYITLLDNMLVVTSGDKQTVLEHTGIEVDKLEQSEIEKLESGIYAEDMNCVFSILESFSS